MSALWHYTCDHGRRAIGERGSLIPAAARPGVGNLSPWTALLVWMTDLDVPVRDGLGLTSHTLTCDRTVYRYRVTDPADCLPWMVVRHSLSPAYRDGVERAPGALPRHWWVSPLPVPVVLDQLGRAAA